LKKETGTSRDPKSFIKRGLSSEPVPLFFFNGLLVYRAVLSRSGERVGRITIRCRYDRHNRFIPQTSCYPFSVSHSSLFDTALSAAKFRGVSIE
jgi:hypothetical protein